MRFPIDLTNRACVLALARDNGANYCLLHMLSDRMLREKWSAEVCGHMLLVHFNSKPTYVI